MRVTQLPLMHLRRRSESTPVVTAGGGLAHPFAAELKRGCPTFRGFRKVGTPNSTCRIFGIFRPDKSSLPTINKTPVTPAVQFPPFENREGWGNPDLRFDRTKGGPAPHKLNDVAAGPHLNHCRPGCPISRVLCEKWDFSVRGPSRQLSAVSKIKILKRKGREGHAKGAKGLQIPRRFAPRDDNGLGVGMARQALWVA